MQLWFFTPEVWHLITKSHAPILRKASAAFVFSTITLVYALNIFDYYGLFSVITTQQRNGYLLYIILSMFVAFKAAQAEGQKRKMSKLLSDEAKRGVEQGIGEISGQGFVILVDAIGFTADRQAFENLPEMRKFAEDIFGSVARSISDLKHSEISLLSTTGDGLYFSLKGPPSKEGLDSAVSVAKKIVQTRLNTALKMRVAIGYGAYTVFLFQEGSFQKEVVFGSVLNDLSRVIGGDGIRVLINEQLKPINFSGPVRTAHDKHGHAHDFCELGHEKLAA
jgi:hypothetical protein